MSDFFWLTEYQFRRLAPLLPAEKGAQAQAIGVSRGGRTTKVHALSDGQGWPLAFLLSAGQAADCRAGLPLLQSLPEGTLVIADRAYDTDVVHRLIEDQGAVPNIPSRVTRRWKSYFSKVHYRNRNAIERMFGRLRDFRHIATRYDKLAGNSLAALCLAAVICYWQ